MRWLIVCQTCLDLNDASRARLDIPPLLPLQPAPLFVEFVQRFAKLLRSSPLSRIRPVTKSRRLGLYSGCPVPLSLTKPSQMTFQGKSCEYVSLLSHSRSLPGGYVRLALIVQISRLPALNPRPPCFRMAFRWGTISPRPKTEVKPPFVTPLLLPARLLLPYHLRTLIPAPFKPSRSKLKSRCFRVMCKLPPGAPTSPSTTHLRLTPHSTFAILARVSKAMRLTIIRMTISSNQPGCEYLLQTVSIHILIIPCTGRLVKAIERG